MIRRVYSDLPTFKNLSFQPGLNVLLVDTTPDATVRQTRNRAGKSSFTEILHFMLGGSVEKGSIFHEPVLHGQKFGLEIDLGKETVAVERVPENRSGPDQDPHEESTEHVRPPPGSSDDEHQDDHAEEESGDG